MGLTDDRNDPGLRDVDERVVAERIFVYLTQRADVSTPLGA